MSSNVNHTKSCPRKCTISFCLKKSLLKLDFMWSVFLLTFLKLSRHITNKLKLLQLLTYLNNFKGFGKEHVRAHVQRSVLMISALNTSTRWSPSPIPPSTGAASLPSFTHLLCPGRTTSGCYVYHIVVCLIKPQLELLWSEALRNNTIIISFIEHPFLPLS